MSMPYVVGPPVRLPTDFFGRERQTRQFYETLAGAQTQCVSVLGLRRAGKTSFLQYVAHPEVRAAYLPDPQQYKMIYVDVSACRTAADFYGRVYHKLIAGLSPAPAGMLRSPQAADAYAVESLLYEYRGRRVVLFLDEFDQLRTADLGDEFMTQLRALAGVWDYELSYVTASYWNLYRLGNFVGLPPTSPFYNIFFPTPIYLSGLSPAELEELVRVPARRVGVAATDEDVAFVRHLAGTLPFFVQAAAAIWLTHKREGRQPDERAVRQRLVSEMGPYYEQWWRHFSDVERDALVAVAQEKPVERLPYDGAEVTAAVERLRNYGVITQTGSRLWVDSALLTHWLHEQSGHTKRAMPAASGAGSNGRPHPTSESVRPEADVERLLAKIATAADRIAPIVVADSAPEAGFDAAAALSAELDGLPDDWTLTAADATGLLARAGSRHAFLISCDRWRGQKGLLQQTRRMMEQLAGETRAVLIYFVNSAPVEVVADAVLQAMPHQAGYIGHTAGSGNRLDFRFRRPGVPPGESVLTVLLMAAAG